MNGNPPGLYGSSPAEAMALDFDGWLSTQPDDVRQQHDWLFQQFPDPAALAAEKQRLASIEFIHENTRRPRGEIEDQWGIYRGGVAERMAGENWLEDLSWIAVKDDDAGFARKVTEHATTRRDERYLLEGAPADDGKPFKPGDTADYSGAFQEAKQGVGPLLPAAMQAAMDGVPVSDVLAKWQASAAGKPGFSAARLGEYERQARAVHTAMTARAQSVLPAVNEIMGKYVKAYNEGLAGYGGEELVDAMEKVPVEDRPVALALLQKAAAKHGAQFPDKAEGAKALGRGIFDMVHGVQRKEQSKMLESADEYLSKVKPGDSIDAATVNDAGNAGLLALLKAGGPGTITAEQIDKAKASVARQWDRLGISIQLEQIGNQQFDPLKGGGFFSDKIYHPFMQGIAPQLGLAALTRKIIPPGAVGGAIGTGKLATLAGEVASGIPAMYAMHGLMADQNAQQLLQQNPGMSLREAYGLGRHAAVYQSGLEYAQMMLGMGLVGKGQSLGRQLMAMQGSAWWKLGTGLVAGAAAQNVVEGVQDITPQVVQWLTPRAPGVDWDTVFYGRKQADGTRDGSGYWAQRAATFWAVLPLVVFGAGGKALRDKAGAEQLSLVASSMTDTRLHAVGIPEEQRAAILAETDPAARLDAFETARQNADPKIAEEGQQRFATEQAESQRSMVTAMQEAGVTMESGQRDGVPVYRVTRNAVPAVDGAPARPAVTTEHGSMTDAQAAVNEHMGAEWAAKSDDLFRMMAALDARKGAPTKESRTTFASEGSVADAEARQVAIIEERQAVLADPNASQSAKSVAQWEMDAAEKELANMQSRKTIHESELEDSRLAVFSDPNATPEAKAEAEKPVKIDWSKMTFAGRSELEVKEGVYRSVARIDQGADVGVVFEEHVENDPKAWVKSGEMTWDGLEGMIREVEGATGDTYIHGHTGGTDAGRDRMSIIEAYSRLSLLYGAGKHRTGDIASIFKDSRNAARARLRAARNGGVAAKLMARLDAAAEWLRVVVTQAFRLRRAVQAAEKAGKPLSVVEYLNRSLGIEVDSAHAAAVQSEAAGIYGEDALTSQEQEDDGIAFAVRAAADHDADGAVSFAVAPADIEHNQRLRAPQAGSLLARTRDEYSGKPAVDNIIYRPGRMYRAIGKAGLADFRESGVLRPKADGKGYDKLYVSRGTTGARYDNSAVAEIDPAQVGEWTDQTAGYATTPLGSINWDSPGVRVFDRQSDGSYAVAHDNIGDEALREDLPDGPSFAIRPRHSLQDLAAAEAKMRSLAGKPMTTADGLTGTVSNASARKMISASAVRKSISLRHHLAAIEEFEELYKTGVVTETKPDRDNDPNIKFIHRVTSGMTVDGEPVNVKFTVKEFARPQEGARIYSVESIETESATERKRGAADTPESPISPPQSVAPRDSGTDPGESQISHRLTPTEQLDRASSILGAKMSRDPDARKKMVAKARGSLAKLKESWSTLRHTWAGDEIRPKVEKRSAAELDKEQSFRQAVRREELEDAAYAKHAGTLAAADLASAWSGPVMAELYTGNPLQGPIQSKSAAMRRGVEIAGEYDGTDGIPRMVFGGNRAPDLVAQDLYEAGKLSEPTPDALWNAIRRDIAGAEKMRQAVRAAEDDLRQAKVTAKEESAEWRREQEELQAKDWNGHAVLLRNLRILDAILTAFPPEVRGKVGGWVQMAKLKTEKAMAAELERRITKLDVVLEESLRKDALEQIASLREKAAPTREAGKKPKGKLGFEAHRFFDGLAAVTELSADQVEAQRVALEKLAADATTPAKAADIFEQQQLLDTFGGLDAKDADGKPLHDAASLVAALDQLETVYETGRNRWRTIEEMRLERVRGLIGETVAAVGKISKQGVQDQKAKASQTLSILKGGRHSLKSFTEVLESLLGREHPLTAKWSREAREAMAARTDTVVEISRRWTKACEAATGKKGRKARLEVFTMGEKQNVRVEVTPETDTEIKVPIDTFFDAESRKSIGLTAAEVDTLTAQFEALPADSQVQNLTLNRTSKDASEVVHYTEAEGIFLSMMWAQDQYQPAMTKAGLGESAQIDIEAGLSDAAKMLRGFIGKEYADGYEPLAKLFRNMFGVDLPQIENYSPGSFYHAGTDAPVDVTGQTQQAGGFRAGFLKDRKRHKAEVAPKSAFQAFFAHANQTAHWRATAELSRELHAVLGSTDVKKAILANHGADMAYAVGKWMEAIDGNGLQVAHGRLTQAIMSMQAHAALAWKLGTLMKQSTALLGAWYRMPTGAYLHGLGRLMAGRLDARAMWRSPVIQRRLEGGFSPEARAAMSQAFGSKPTIGNEFLRRGMELIGYTDALFTAGSAAISYDYHYRAALKNGASEADARAIAENEAADMVSRTAQPVETTDRSIFELDMKGIGKTVFIFGSEARQKSSMWLTAWGRTLTGQATAADLRVLLISHLIVGPLIQSITNAWRDARDDDDDEWFDEKNWKPGDWLRAIIAGPMSGIPVIRDAVDGYNGDSGPLSRFGFGYNATMDILGGPDDGTAEKAEWYEKKLAAVLQAIPGELGTAIGAGASITDQAFRTADNLTNTAEERESKIKKLERKWKSEKDSAEKEDLRERIDKLKAGR